MNVPRRTAVGEQPQYSKLEPLTFQDLCKEILQASPDFRNVQVYGRPGQMQRGIDILAERLSPSGLTVGQCKRFQTFDTVDFLLHLRSIGKLSDAEFYRYLNRYRASGLRFLALRKDEILYWLNAAIGSNGQFKESYELFIVRLSHARALGDSNTLRTTPVIDGQP